MAKSSAAQAPAPAEASPALTPPYKINGMVRLKEAIHVEIPRQGKVRLHTVMKGKVLDIIDGKARVEFTYADDPVEVTLKVDKFEPADLFMQKKK